MKPSDFATSIYDLFPPFRQWDDVTLEAWTGAVVREAGAFDPVVRQNAFDSLVRSKQKEKPPQVGTIVAHLAEAHRWIETKRQSETLAVVHDGGASPQNRDWTAERLKLASELMNTPMGKQAAKEGWVGALWSFARKNQRLPQQGEEIEWCKESARGFDEAYAECLMIPNDPHKHGLAEIRRALEKIGAEMLRRRHATERRVLGGAS